MGERIGNACGCGHAKAYHPEGRCIAVTDLYQCGCVGYVRNYLVLFGRGLTNPPTRPKRAR